MLEQLSYEMGVFVEQGRDNIGFWLLCIGALWVFNLINWAIGRPLTRFGIIPRKVYGLPGIAFAPFLHGNPNHLFFNSVPLAVLGLFLLADGLEMFIIANLMMMVISGVAVWCFGRPGNHIGASGVIAGYFGYVLASAYQKPTFTSILLAVVALYYFWGIIFSILPSDESTSWEGHLSGLLSGILAKYMLPYVEMHFM